jgi:DEAD/DEAH box helicase
MTDTTDSSVLIDETLEVPDAVALEHAANVPLDEEAVSHPLIGDAPVVPEAPTFAELQVDPRIVQALLEAGIERTFAIQALTLPIALIGSDLIGQARTGMGKTLGFGVPLLQRLDLPGEGTPQALVVVPTRELCVQVTEDLRKAGLRLGARLLAVYGGRSYEPQVEALRNGVDVVVGTPGRLLDLARQGHLKLGSIQTLVLDEADEMLDLGFLPDIERIPAARRCCSRPPCRGRSLRWPAGSWSARSTSGPSSPTRAGPFRPPASTSSVPTPSTKLRCWPASCRRRAVA